MQKITIGCWSQLKKAKIYFVLILSGIICSCAGNDSLRILSTSQDGVILEKTKFGKIHNWDDDDFEEVIPVFTKNCEAISKINKAYIYDSQIKIPTKDYKEICLNFTKKEIDSSRQMRKFIENNFTPYLVTTQTGQTGKFTSYYEASIKASFEKDGKYKYPIYGKPYDLIEINLQDFDKNLPKMRLVGRIDSSKMIPYYNRAEIENNGINAPILMWGDSLVDIHFMQIQGSAVAEMNDGTEVRIGFADSNGHKFKGIGSILLEKGLLKSGEVSMPKIREWLQDNPKVATKYMAENGRFIFHRFTNADGPVGALGISLSAGRSIAVDNKYIPLGTMMWLNTKDPDNRNIEKIVFAQDIGSAIKGVVRGDYFWGHGEDALYYAGRMNSQGSYYILVPKNSNITVQ